MSFSFCMFALEECLTSLKKMLMFTYGACKVLRRVQGGNIMHYSSFLKEIWPKMFIYLVRKKGHVLWVYPAHSDIFSANTYFVFMLIHLLVTDS